MNRLKSHKTPIGVFFPLRGKPRNKLRGRGDFFGTNQGIYVLLQKGEQLPKNWGKPNSFSNPCLT